MKDTYNKHDIRIAESIIRTFETGRPDGNYSAVAVLNDGAGISYGAGQFTHRSGSLAAVVRRYLSNGDRIGREVFEDILPLLSLTDAVSISRAARDRELRRTLSAAGRTTEMRDAQDEVLRSRYMTPALRECSRRGFVEPLSLAVIYDSFVHGSYQRISRRAGAVRGERTWITAYVRNRHDWLRSIPRLRSTSYRTAFFLGEILKQNWHLDTPLMINGRRVNIPRPVERHVQAADLPYETHVSEYGEMAMDGSFAAQDDVSHEMPRSDGRRSMWATVLGSIGQAAFAVGGFIAGLPVEVWLGAALIIAVLIIVYLYRQLALGRMREAVCINCEKEKLL